MDWRELREVVRRVREEGRLTADLTAPPAHILNWGNLTGSAPRGSVANRAC